MPIALAMDGLLSGLTLVVQRQTDDQSDYRAHSAEVSQSGEISIEAAPLESCQGADGDSECIASSQSDPTSPHIKAED